MRQRRGRPKPLTVEQVEAVLAASRAHGLIHEALVAVLLYTGLRESEVRRLRWDEMRGAGTTLRQKGGTERDAYLSSDLTPELARLRAAAPGNTGRLFPSPVKLGGAAERPVDRAMGEAHRG